MCVCVWRSQGSLSLERQHLFSIIFWPFYKRLAIFSEASHRRSLLAPLYGIIIYKYYYYYYCCSRCPRHHHYHHPRPHPHDHHHYKVNKAQA